MASSAPLPISIRFLGPLALGGVFWLTAPAIAQEESPGDGAAAEQEQRTEPERGLERAAPAEDLPLEIPADDPPALRIPENLGSEPPPSGDERVPENIRDALQGRESQSGTGDAILDGVLDAIRRRGSVLDGSPLEPRAGDDAPLTQPELRPLPREEFNRRDEIFEENRERPRGRRRSSAPRSPSRPAVDAEARFLLAEQLLKTARLLASRDENDPARRKLVADLRDEAVRLLAAPPRPRSDGGPAPAGYDEPSRPY